jgi:hypothetical protein
MTVYSNDERDLCASLSLMHKTAMEKTQFNQTEARNKMQEWLAQDRRFDGFDPDRLVKRIEECKSCGRTADLSDPYLKRGGQRRPNSW